MSQRLSFTKNAIFRTESKTPTIYINRLNFQWNHYFEKTTTTKQIQNKQTKPRKRSVSKLLFQQYQRILWKPIGMIKISLVHLLTYRFNFWWEHMQFLRSNQVCSYEVHIISLSCRGVVWDCLISLLTGLHISWLCWTGALPSSSMTSKWRVSQNFKTSEFFLDQTVIIEATPLLL